MKKPIRRKIYVVDNEVQGMMMRKVARYWCVSLFLAICFTALGWMFITPGLGTLLEIREYIPSLFGAFLIAIGASIVALPFILFDVARTTNRFAGPLFRLRNTMKKAIAGEKVAPIHFRDGDYWHDLADLFNQLVAKLEQQGENKSSSSESVPQEQNQLEESLVG